MTDRLNAILERVLSEELGKQSVWKEDDKKHGFPIDTRNEAIKDIEDFMKVNGIKLNRAYYFDGKNKA